MHYSSRLRMEWFYKNYCISDNNEIKRVLDIGSYCVEGHFSYRSIFDEKYFKYTGLDMVEGPNVNIVAKSPYKWSEIEDNYYDILISGQTFEHIEFPWITITEMTRVLKTNGLVCIIAPNNLGLHRYPVDCWRYYSDGMVVLARWAGLEVLHVSTNLAPKNASPYWYDYWQDCMLIARKPENIKRIDIDNYTCEPVDLEKIATGLIPFKKQSWKYKYIDYRLQHFAKQYLSILVKRFFPKLYEKLLKT